MTLSLRVTCFVPEYISLKKNNNNQLSALFIGSLINISFLYELMADSQSEGGVL